MNQPVIKVTEVCIESQSIIYGIKLNVGFDHKVTR